MCKEKINNGIIYKGLGGLHQNLEETWLMHAVSLSVGVALKKILGGHVPHVLSSLPQFPHLYILNHFLYESSPATAYTATATCCSGHDLVDANSYRETLFPCSSSTLGVPTHQYLASPLPPK